MAGGWLLDRLPGSHGPFTASVLVASAGAALIPTASSLPGILAAFLVMAGPGRCCRPRHLHAF